MMLITTTEAGREFECRLLDSLLSILSVLEQSVSLHCGFITPESSDHDSSMDEPDNTNGDEARFLLSRVTSGISFNDSVNIDKQALTSQMLTVEEIVTT